MKIFYSVIASLIFFSSAKSQSCDPLFGKLVINEFMAKNQSTIADQDGEFNDWVEIYNGSEASINLLGYFLTDNASNETKWSFPDVDIAANGYLIVWADADTLQAGLHTNFKLSGTGEELTIYSPDTVSLDFIKYGPQVTNASTGRFPNGVGPFVPMEDSYAATNLNSIFVKLVINEYMASNFSTIADENGGFGDWAELYNNSNFAINLNGYYLSNKIKEPEKWKFPSVSIPALGFLTIWCDGDSLDGLLHTNFNLDSENDDLVLSNPDTTTIDYVRFQNQITDFSEGRFPNGNGAINCLLPTYNLNNSLNTINLEPDFLSPLFTIQNPANTNIEIHFKNPYTGIISLYNTTGSKVFEKNYQHTIDLKEDIIAFKDGIYLLVGSGFVSKIRIEK